ncbi:unnamed protein product, partial [Ilex paraguariensis]
EGSDLGTFFRLLFIIPRATGVLIRSGSHQKTISTGWSLRERSPSSTLQCGRQIHQFPYRNKHLKRQPCTVSFTPLNGGAGLKSVQPSSDDDAANALIVRRGFVRRQGVEENSGVKPARPKTNTWKSSHIELNARISYKLLKLRLHSCGGAASSAAARCVDQSEARTHLAAGGVRAAAASRCSPPVDARDLVSTAELENVRNTRILEKKRE